MMKKKTDVIVRKRRRRETKSLRGVLIFTLCGVIGFAGVVGAFSGLSKRSKVYAMEGSQIPAGMSGIINSVDEYNCNTTKVSMIGTGSEDVLVGQRVQTVSNAGLDMATQVSGAVNGLAHEAEEKVREPKIMTDEDYYTLLRIVEAEAGDNDVKGRVLVANVILNRVKRDDFPNSVTEVVFQYVNGVPQFAPTYDGSYYSVTVSDETREAVRQALTGVDYSDGALFFIMKSAMEKESISWFETDLKKLFRYGDHDFYTYPDSIDMVNTSGTTDGGNTENGETDDNTMMMASTD